MPNCYGYSCDVARLVLGRKGADRMRAEGYREEKSTATPFDTMLRNRASRYDVAMEAVRRVIPVNERVALRAIESNSELCSKTKRAQDHLRDRS